MNAPVGYDALRAGINAERVKAHLQQGAARGLSAAQMVLQLTGRQYWPAAERALRMMVESLRAEGLPICATPNHGYFWAETPEELDRTCEYLYSRAMTSLTQIARMKRVSVPDLRGQLRMPLAPVQSERAA
jgi:hypothetical protein